MHISGVVRSLLYLIISMGMSGASFARVGIGIVVNFGPPAIPVYEQPMCPGDGYLWVPGFWDYSEEYGYYWVPGTWVRPPRVGYLWTPGYWGWGRRGYVFHEGYWGRHVGFYGGINYRYGYGGRGYDGGRWEGDRFAYNTYVNRVDTTVIHNTYNTRVENVTVNRVSYNGGNGGINARPTSQEEAYRREGHVGRVRDQNQHLQQARSNPELRASANHGRPPIAATTKPADFRYGVVNAREAGAPYRPPEPKSNGNAQRNPQTKNDVRHESNVTGNHDHARAGNNPRPESTSRNVPANAAHTNPTHTNSGHAKEGGAHEPSMSNSNGNYAAARDHQQQQEGLAAKQNQQHQNLQRQQEMEHQQATKNARSEAQKQQTEQRHAQQKQHSEQQHGNQQNATLPTHANQQHPAHQAQPNQQQHANPQQHPLQPKHEEKQQAPRPQRESQPAPPKP